jgi:hypothetical protein
MTSSGHNWDKSEGDKSCFCGSRVAPLVTGDPALVADAGQRASQMELLMTAAARGRYKERNNANDSLRM